VAAEPRRRLSLPAMSLAQVLSSLPPSHRGGATIAMATRGFSRGRGRAHTVKPRDQRGEPESSVMQTSETLMETKELYQSGLGLL